jgi:hypothetical protein
VSGGNGNRFEVVLALGIDDRAASHTLLGTPMVLGNCSVGGVACSALADADAVELSWSIAGEKLSNAKLNSGFVMLPASVRLLSLM